MFRKLFAKKPLARVSITGMDAIIEVGRNETVLEAALKAGIAYPHDCTVGTCGSCRSRLLSGKVDAITPFGYTLSREELQAGYILACQAVPESDLTIEVPLCKIPPRKVTGKIVERVSLTHDIARVGWEVSERIEYTAGQYMTMVWPGAPGPRSYSFSTAPVPGGSNRLFAFIRRVPGGVFTDALFAGQLDDVQFEIEAPLGTFWLRGEPAASHAPIVLIGGGSGLSPLMSLLEDALANEVSCDAILLFGARGERDLYCQEQIASIAARWKGRLDFRPVLSEERADGFRQGLVTDEVAPALAELGDPSLVQAYLCGPPGMIDAGIRALIGAGVPLPSIFYDKFTDASTGKKKGIIQDNWERR